MFSTVFAVVPDRGEIAPFAKWKPIGLLNVIPLTGCPRPLAKSALPASLQAFPPLSEIERLLCNGSQVFGFSAREAGYIFGRRER